MNDKRHVGLVDSHAKGVGRHHNRLAVIEKILLIGGALFFNKSGVVSCGRISFLTQSIADVLHSFSGGTIDDSAFSGIFCENLIDLVHFLLWLAHTEKQILPVKPCLYRHRILQVQQCGNIRLDLLSRRGSERTADRTNRQLFHKRHDVQIALPEILSPLGNTVCLIHRHHGNRNLCCQRKKMLRHQALRCSIQNPVLSVPHSDHRIGKLCGRDGTVEVRRRNPHLMQRLHLIFHQRDQRRNDDCKPRQEHGGNLIAHGFSGTSGHDRQHIPSLQNGIDCLLLSAAELPMSKILLQQRLRCSHNSCAPSSGSGCHRSSSSCADRSRSSLGFSPPMIRAISRIRPSSVSGMTCVSVLPQSVCFSIIK